MIKVQDFAQECGITDRQIHRLLNKYEDEIVGHFERQGQNGTWLDETACQILRSKMKKLPPSVSDQQTVREKQALEAENKRLNEMLGAQGIMIGQMSQQITELQQFKLETVKKQQALEASREAQERRERELDEREGQMAQQISEAAQKASEVARKAAEAEKDQEIAQIHQEASEVARRAAENEKILEGFIQDAKNELAAVQEDAQTKLSEKDAIIQEQEKKIQELENRSRWQRFLDVFK